MVSERTRLACIATVASAAACSPLPHTVPDEHAVIAGLAPTFLRCYDDELETAPEMRGDVRLEARVDARGHVTRVVTMMNGSLSATVLACLEEHMKTARFSPPDDEPAIVVVPMTFEPAR
ncbi:MAG: AgmX/PglI C-terminal domain-containing protein [Polyangiaceae bacterium]